MKQEKQLLSLFAFLGLVVTFTSNAEYRRRYQQQQQAPAAVRPVMPVTPVRPVAPVQPVLPVKNFDSLARLEGEIAKNQATVMLIYSKNPACTECPTTLVNFEALARQNPDILFVQEEFEKDLDITHDAKYITEAVPAFVILDRQGIVRNAGYEFPTRATIMRAVSGKFKQRQDMRGNKGKRFAPRRQRQIRTRR